MLATGLAAAVVQAVHLSVGIARAGIARHAHRSEVRNSLPGEEASLELIPAVVAVGWRPCPVLAVRRRVVWPGFAAKAGAGHAQRPGASDIDGRHSRAHLREKSGIRGSIGIRRQRNPEVHAHNAPLGSPLERLVTRAFVSIDRVIAIGPSLDRAVVAPSPVHQLDTGSWVGGRDAQSQIVGAAQEIVATIVVAV